MSKRISFHPALASTADRTAELNLDFAKPFETQVIEHLRGVGDLREFEEVALPGQAVAAILVLPILEMACGLPKLTLYGFGPDRALTVEGVLALGDYRQNVVRPRRPELMPGDAFEGYTVLDGGGRGLTPLQKTELAAALGCDEDEIRVLDLRTGHVDFKSPTAGMVEKVIETGVSFQDLTSGRCLYLPAGSGLVAACQAATIYGLGEAWPRTIRLNRAPDGTFHVDEICDPQGLRQEGVRLGASWRAGQAPVVLPRPLAVELAHFLEAYRLGNEKHEFGVDWVLKTQEEIARLLG